MFSSTGEKGLQLSGEHNIYVLSIIVLLYCLSTTSITVFSRVPR